MISGNATVTVTAAAAQGGPLPANTGGPAASVPPRVARGPPAAGPTA